jgi:hypothetical protein
VRVDIERRGGGHRVVRSMAFAVSARSQGGDREHLIESPKPMGAPQLTQPQRPRRPSLDNFSKVFAYT